VHKEFIPEGKAVNAEYYKGVMDRLLKHIQWVCSAAFCSWDFFSLHDNAPTHKAAFANFLPWKRLQPFITPRTLQIYLFQTIFCSPEVKRTPVCRCCRDPRSCNWWIKEGLKRGIFSSFSETVQPCKSLYTSICHWSLFWVKNKRYVSSSCVFDF